eukprot:COSAG01_NODE_18976_length_1039_cov_4.467487_1_plen_24_part_10
MQEVPGAPATSTALFAGCLDLAGW